MSRTQKTYTNLRTQSSAPKWKQETREKCTHCGDRFCAAPIAAKGAKSMKKSKGLRVRYDCSIPDDDG